MKNKLYIFIALISLGVLCGCGQSGKSNQQDLSQFGDYYGDSDDPADEPTNTSTEQDAVFKVIKDYWTYVFVTTKDGSQYYLYDDETDYSEDFLAFFIVANAIQNESDAKKYNPYLIKVYDLPHLDNSVPAELKERFLETYYYYKDKDFYDHGKGYGYQKYDFSRYLNDDPMLTTPSFRRFKSKDYKDKSKFQDVPDGALMFVR